MTTSDHSIIHRHTKTGALHRLLACVKLASNASDAVFTERSHMGARSLVVVPQSEWAQDYVSSESDAFELTAALGEMPTHAPARVHHQHVDGGLYLPQHVAHMADSGEEVVVYEHLWPFERYTWVRDINEWNGVRFVPISKANFDALTSGSREAMRHAITERRNARKFSKK